MVVTAREAVEASVPATATARDEFDFDVQFELARIALLGHARYSDGNYREHSKQMMASAEENKNPRAMCYMGYALLHAYGT